MEEPEGARDQQESQVQTPQEGTERTSRENTVTIEPAVETGEDPGSGDPGYSGNFQDTSGSAAEENENVNDDIPQGPSPKPELKTSDFYQIKNSVPNRFDHPGAVFSSVA